MGTPSSSSSIAGTPAASAADHISKVVNGLHGFLESEQVGADIAIASLVSAAGEVALGMIVARPENRDAYLKLFNSTVEQVRAQLRRELKERKI
jgi:hypothetical protein